MRIIAGKYKGRNLAEFSLDTTRPTADLVRGAIFNIIGSGIQDACFLDLFSGTGTVGIEAISRGAKQVFFVDNNAESVVLIKKNLNFIKETNYQVIKNEYYDALKNFSKLALKFDYIFLDPPYKTELAEKALRLINRYNLIGEQGKIYWEHDETKLKLLGDVIAQIKTKKYGKKYLSIMDLEQLKVFIKLHYNE